MRYLDLNDWKMFSEVAIETYYVQLCGLGSISPQRTLSSSEMLSNNQE